VLAKPGDQLALPLGCAREGLPQSQRTNARIHLVLGDIDTHDKRYHFAPSSTPFLARFGLENSHEPGGILNEKKRQIFTSGAVHCPLRRAAPIGTTANLSEPAKQIWQATVAAFRSDWFSGCSPVLAAYCETAVGERQVARILAECSPQDERWPEIIKLYCSVTSSLSSLGTRLRITP
jgi:hypothetical protein